MPAALKFEKISEPSAKPLAMLSFGSLSMGREDDNGMVVDGTGVSRRHGKISEAGSQWVYRDLKSTNGSWVNGAKLSSGQAQIIRPGDIVQLADVGIRVVKGQGLSTTEVNNTILIFDTDNFLKEVVLNQASDSIVISGSLLNLSVDQLPKEEAPFVIQRIDGHFKLTVRPGGVPVLVNGLTVGDPSSVSEKILSDRDLLTVGQYELIVNAIDKEALPLPEARRRPMVTPEQKASVIGEHTVTLQAYKDSGEGWHSEIDRRKQKGSANYIFQAAPERSDHGSSEGHESKPSWNFSGHNEPEIPQGPAGNQKLLMITGAIFLVLVVVTIGLAIKLFQS
jgi:pSer/pThr/pTyr-binding forkhead associated (FHA) protein